MGGYLSAPITEKESSEGENNSFKYGVTAMQGWRTEMEDAHAAVLNVSSSSEEPLTGYFAVFDGHGGKEVAKFAARHLAAELVKSEAWRQGDLTRALTDTYLRIDEILGQENVRKELSELAWEGRKQEQAKSEEDWLVNGELPPEVRDALISRYLSPGQGGKTAGGNLDDDDDYGGSEYEEDTDFKPLTDLEDDAPAAVLGDTDIMLRDDSETDDSADVTESSAQEMTDASPDRQGEAGPSSSSGAPPASPPPVQYNAPIAGCTAVVAVVRGDTLVVANAGDSRCVCSRGGTAVAMTTDHKPDDIEEHARITKAGGFIAAGRVNGSLNLSRALGDLEFKRTKELPPAQQMITALPEVRALKLEQGDEFIILACDGIWDVLSNQQAVEFARQRLQSGMAPLAVCEAMCDACLAPNTNGCGEGCDNMSAMIVVLKDFAGSALAEGALPVPPQL